MHFGDWADLCRGEFCDRLAVLGGEPEDQTVRACASLTEKLFGTPGRGMVASGWAHRQTDELESKPVCDGHLGASHCGPQPPCDHWLGFSHSLCRLCVVSTVDRPQRSRSHGSLDSSLSPVR